MEKVELTHWCNYIVVILSDDLGNPIFGCKDENEVFQVLTEHIHNQIEPFVEEDEYGESAPWLMGNGDDTYYNALFHRILLSDVITDTKTLEEGFATFFPNEGYIVIDWHGEVLYQHLVD